MKYNYILLIAVTLALTMYSCKERSGKNINQGEIHYNIDYIRDVGTVPKELLPQNLVISFKKDKILFEIVSSIGNSGIVNISNPEKNIFDTYFSLFSQKYFYEAKPGEMFPYFEQMEGIIINKTSKTSVICGYNCKNAQVTFSKDLQKVYDIWYTTEIDVQHANACTPFEKIDGVLMSFFFLLGPAELHFNAETVYKKEIPDKAFGRREKYSRVSKEDINRLINKMISL